MIVDKRTKGKRRSTEEPALLSETSRMILCGDITLDAKFLGMAAGLCHIICKLHPPRDELAVSALFTRAGFKVEPGPLTNDKKQPDWCAYDAKTGTKMVAEAKSRHRLGTLHEDGQPDMEKIQRGDVANLVGQALDQNHGDCAFLVFVDLNVPREQGVPVEQRPWFNDVWQDMQSLGTPTPETPDEFTAVFFTNFWHHWGGTTIATGAEYLPVLSHCPRYTIPVALEGRLMASVQNYSFIPGQI